MFAVCLLDDDLNIISEIKRFFHPIDAKRLVKELEGFTTGIFYIEDGLY